MLSDPSLDQDFTEFYQSQLPLLLKSQSQSLNDLIMVRLFHHPQSFKIELTSQANISFFYFIVLSHQQLQQLAGIPEGGEIPYLKDIFSGKYKYELKLQTKETAVLTITVQEKYKEYQLAIFHVLMGSEETVKASVMYRYQRMKMREKLLDHCYENISGIIRVKNPSLLGLLEQKNKKIVFK